MAMLKIRKPNGEIVEVASLPGAKGEDGKTPVKGVDYFTPEERAEFTSEANAYTDEKTASAETTDNKVDSVDMETAYAKPEAYPNLRAVYEYGYSRLEQANAYTDEKLAPATSETYGTVKCWSDERAASISNGIYMDADGMLRFVPASESAIDSKSNPFAPIVPSNLDYAVKSVGDGYYALASDVGDVETALDTILAMQESLIGGDA